MTAWGVAPTTTDPERIARIIRSVRGNDEATTYIQELLAYSARLEDEVADLLENR